MYYWLVFLVIPSLAFAISKSLTDKSQNSNLEYSFMTIPHTTACRAIAATGIIISHIAGNRIFTPLDGIGVSIFLMLSGYGVNESYKRKDGGIGKLKLNVFLLHTY